jgi:radical SAM family uncharacterized protein
MNKKFDRHRRRLLDEETGAIRKRRHAKTTIALVYPNTYHVGMSNLGFQTVYHQLNALDDIVCERSFLPETRFKNANDIITLESGRPLRQFDLVAFSISFENDFPNILTILDMAEIPLKGEERGDSHPLVAAGGVACFLNPESIAPYIDCFFIGEAEAILPLFFEKYFQEDDRQKRLKHLAQNVKGIYVPSFYESRYLADGTFESLEPRIDVPRKITRVYLRDLDTAATSSVILTPNTTFDQTHLVEVSRGCPHGCRFCGAGFVYRPPRFRSLNLLNTCMQAGVARSDKIGLVGAAVSDLPSLDQLCSHVNPDKTTLSFSSLRADALDNSLISHLKNSGVKTATIAPDAGSERLRRAINKGLCEADILNAAENLVANGIPNLKLYFMIGLPTEETEDLEAIIDLCKKIKHRFLKSSRNRKKIGEITVSLNSFVPKPHTPFQWAAMDEMPLLKEKIKRIKTGLRRVSNVQVHADIPKWAYIQALLSRGDRRVSAILGNVLTNNGNWAKTFKESPINPDFYVIRERSFEETFPWDFIDHGIRKSFLKSEYQKAIQNKSTEACVTASCKRCGVCPPPDDNQSADK